MGSLVSDWACGARRRGGGSKPCFGERLSRGCGLRGGETGPSGAGDGDTGVDKGDEGSGQEEEEGEAYIGSGL